MPTEQKTPARVKVNLGYTVKMAEYETMRIDFGIEDNVWENEKSSETFDRLFDWTFKRLNKEVDRARQAARG